MRDQYSPTGAYDRVQAEVGFVGQTCERKYRLRGLTARRPQRGSEMLSGQHVFGLAQKVKN